MRLVDTEDDEKFRHVVLCNKGIHVEFVCAETVFLRERSVNSPNEQPYFTPEGHRIALAMSNARRVDPRPNPKD